MKATYDNSSLKLETLDSSFITRCNTIYSVISKQLYALKSISVYNVNDITAMIIKKLRDKTQDKFFIKYHPTTRKICCDQIQRHFKLLTYKSILMIQHKGVTQIWDLGARLGFNLPSPPWHQRKTSHTKYIHIVTLPLKVLAKCRTLGETQQRPVT